jgi:hypothetical protein
LVVPEPICTDEALLAELRRVAKLADPPPPGPAETPLAGSRTRGRAGDRRDNRPPSP